MTYRCVAKPGTFGSPAEKSNTIFVPSGDQDGHLLIAVPEVSTFTFEPSGAIVAIWLAPSGSMKVNAIRVPSGDHSVQKLGTCVTCST